MRFELPLPLSDSDALSLADAGPDDAQALVAAAGAVRDRAWGRRVTFSPKVFLPITNLCRDRCTYCSFRKSPGDAGEWTMAPHEVHAALDRAAAQGCSEALLCLGDRPESAFPSYKRKLAEWGHADTTSYLEDASRLALARGLLPHTNAGILTRAEMQRLAPLNVSLGLMLETASARLGEPGMPHHRAPDKRPAVRLRMIDEAGQLKIPFTTGILIGIGETRRERVEALLAIRELHRAHGHVQEVIVQTFRAHAATKMHDAPELADAEIAHAIALARLVLDDEVTVQAPPNLNASATKLLLDAGINDFGGISAVTPDYINPKHPWPHLDGLAEACARHGYELRPRLAIHEAFIDRPGFLPDALRPYVARARERLARVARPSELASRSAATATPR
jgi:FO synthase